MICIPEISEGKVIAAVERKGNQNCCDCILQHWNGFDGCKEYIACNSTVRKDRKNVIFKLLDYPGKKAAKNAKI